MTQIKAEDIYCQLTGIQPEGVELFGIDDENKIPAGWVRISIAKSKHTKEYKAALAAVRHMIAAKGQQFDEQLNALPENNRPSPAEIKRLKNYTEVESKAFFAAYIATIDKFTVEEEVVYLAPDSKTGNTNEAINKIYEVIEDLSGNESPNDDESDDEIEDVEDENEDDTDSDSEQQ